MLGICYFFQLHIFFKFLHYSTFSNVFQHLTTVFLLHGYHTLELFSELEEEDLDELCILQPEERAKIVTAAQLLVDCDS